VLERHPSARPRHHLTPSAVGHTPRLRPQRPAGGRGGRRGDPETTATHPPTGLPSLPMHQAALPCRPTASGCSTNSGPVPPGARVGGGGGVFAFRRKRRDRGVGSRWEGSARSSRGVVGDCSPGWDSGRLPVSAGGFPGRRRRRMESSRRRVAVTRTVRKGVRLFRRGNGKSIPDWYRQPGAGIGLRLGQGHSRALVYCDESVAN
jgi:hypothetical protein